LIVEGCLGVRIAGLALLGPRRTGDKAMFRNALAALAAVVLVGATLMPDDAFARRGGGGGYRGGGYHGGAAHFRGGAVHGGRYGVAGRGYGVAGRGYGYRPVARTAVRRGVYGAAVGAAAVGAYGYYNNRCYQDGYGNTVCPQQYPY
jgi:hypothetical protein